MGTEGNGNTSNERPCLLTVPEVAFFLHVHVNTIRRWCNRGVIKSYRINSRGDRRFKKEEIQQFLEELNRSARWDIMQDMQVVSPAVQIYEDKL